MNKSLFKDLCDSVKEMVEVRTAKTEGRLPKCLNCKKEMTEHINVISNGIPVIHYHCADCFSVQECERCEND
jgi:hypothetical protein